MFAANGMMTRGPVNGHHVSYIYWFKIMSLAEVDPATSGQGGKTWQEPPTDVPLVVPCNIYDEIYLNVCICVSLGRDRAGA
jgi:hypothetical protein